MWTLASLAVSLAYAKATSHPADPVLFVLNEQAGMGVHLTDLLVALVLVPGGIMLDLWTLGRRRR